MVGVGALRNLVTIQAPPTAQDALGQPTGDWTAVAAVHADIRHLSGLETIKADAQATVTRASIRIRRRTDVTTAMRVVWGETVYQITAVLPTADRRWLDLACQAVA